LVGIRVGILVGIRDRMEGLSESRLTSVKLRVDGLIESCVIITGLFVGFLVAGTIGELVRLGGLNVIFPGSPGKFLSVILKRLSMIFLNIQQ